MLIARRNLMAGKPLPYDAEVEYIESSGYQEIYTEMWKNDINASFVYKCRMQATATEAQYIGLSDEAGCYLSTTNHLFSLGGGVVMYGVDANEMNDVTFFAAPAGQESTITVNSVVIKRVRQNRSPYYPRHGFTPFSVFGEAHLLSKLKLSAAKLIQNDFVVMDLRAVRFTNENGVSEGAMYDRLGVGGMNPDGSLRNDGLYRNRGTGAFGWKDMDGTIVPPQ